MLLAWQVTAWATRVGEMVHAQQERIEIPQYEGRFGWWDTVKDGEYLVECSFVRLGACGGDLDVQNEQNHALVCRCVADTNPPPKPYKKQA